MHDFIEAARFDELPPGTGTCVTARMLCVFCYSLRNDLSDRE
jgi:hypothetical protein